MAWKHFDYDVAFQSLIDLVEMKLSKVNNDRDMDFQWLQKYPVEVKEMLERPTEEFKMPKTPARQARKKCEQQKNYALFPNNEVQSNHVPLKKKQKLSNDKDKLKEMIVSGRPKREASSAAKLKIQQSFIKLSLKQKLQRPSSEEKPANKSVAVYQSNMTNQVIEGEHLISTVNHSKIRAKKGGKETTISRPKVDKFPSESNSWFYGRSERVSSIEDSQPIREKPVEVPSVQAELPKRTRTATKVEKIPMDDSVVELDTDPTVRTVAVAKNGEERTRPAGKIVFKKKDEEEKVPHTPEVIQKNNSSVHQTAEEKTTIFKTPPSKKDKKIVAAVETLVVNGVMADSASMKAVLPKARLLLRPLTPIVHLNRYVSIVHKNQSTLMLGHSESYSANPNRPTGISSVACKPTTIPLVTKSSGEEEAQRKEEKQKRLKDIKDKEGEVARKREYLIKVKTQEQKKVQAATLYKQQAAEALDQQQLMKNEQQRQQLVAIKEKEEKENQAKQAFDAEQSSTGDTTHSSLATKTSSPKLSEMTKNYQITPVRFDKTGNAIYPNQSDDSEDSTESGRQKAIPSWARSASLKSALTEQAKGLVDTDALFPTEDLLQDPNLDKIFKKKKARFNKRTSSAVWKSAPANYM